LENSQISNFMKIHSVGTKLFHADRQTDRQTDTTKKMVTFHNFEKVPNNQVAFQNLMIKLPVHIWA